MLDADFIGNRYVATVFLTPYVGADALLTQAAEFD